MPNYVHQFKAIKIYKNRVIADLKVSEPSGFQNVLENVS